MGGPDGGEGGKGGDITVRGDSNLATLLDYTYRDTWKAERGEHGMGANKSGRGGASIVMPRCRRARSMKDLETGEMIGEILEDGEELSSQKAGAAERATHFSPPQRISRRANGSRAKKGRSGRSNSS